ncbi:major facilitator superfamily MFS_1 [Terriglobus saanensis SP1PR4]|uniref:Major facilitator superfamily MFS_1 n=2 Tax=Terriglobus saanensis TaxID=870903 RepID=E8V4X9_TERSS|nr:DHA2 family efflux MFS transporter permease subunit [Terriglobus saanensis]ADV82607.1 major facilitator superfamily MFS_1 [Terriglobus saanensis SP1PR4]
MSPGGLSRRSFAIAMLVAGALFMENLDGTIIATGLPAMAGSFRTGVVDVNIGVTSYLLALAVFIPISGWMADRFGTRKVFSSAIAIFTLASIWCGSCHTLTQFTLARVVQGLGGSMMVPVGRLMTVRETPKHQIMRTIAYTVWPALVAPILGPPLGGWITTYFNWRWMFLLNVPIGLVLLVCTFILVRDERRHRTTPFDWIGFVLVGLACFSLIEWMEFSSKSPVRWSLVTGLGVLAMSSAFGAVWHLRRTKAPLFHLDMLKVATFRAVTSGGSWFRMAIFVTPFLLPLMFQVGFGMSAFAAGSLVVAVFAGNLAMKPLTTPLLRRYGFRRVLIVNGALTALVFFACARLSPATPHWAILLVLFLSGLGRSMQLTSLTTLCFADLPEDRMSSGSAMFAMAQQLNTSIGVGLGAMIIRLVAWRYDGGVEHLREFHAAFWVVGLLMLCGLPSILALRPDAGDTVAGRSTALLAAEESSV